LAVASFAFFFASIHEFIEHRAVVAHFANTPREKVPPTVYGEHSGLSVALTCLGLACVVKAVQR
jgi:hypothetical protein